MTTTMNLTINNAAHSGADSSDVYVCILGNDPSDADNKFGYYDFDQGKAVYSDKSSWKLDPCTMVWQLSKITSPVPLPNINSGRIYISVYGKFDTFPDSGPSASQGNGVLFDKIEFDSGSNPNINGTSVDFYGISYTISGTDENNGAVSYGYSKSRKTIINALNNFTASGDDQDYGNTQIMKKNFVNNGSGETIRVMSPKSMALGDWGSTESEFVKWGTRCSHFLDDYIKNHCFKPNRKFSFYSKLYEAGKDNTVYYGTTNTDGTEMNLWTDKKCTQPYTVASLAPPYSAYGTPSFKPEPNKPSLYHNVNGAADTIDWGFLLLGNSEGTGAAANWGSDPLCMAIMVSICRGVMHLDDGTTSWIDPTKYYQGDNGTSTANLPIFWYSKILHEQGDNGKAYVLSYDDVYGYNPSIFNKGNPDITIDLHGLDKVTLT